LWCRPVNRNRGKPLGNRGAPFLVRTDPAHLPRPGEAAIFPGGRPRGDRPPLPPTGVINPVPAEPTPVQPERPGGGPPPVWPRPEPVATCFRYGLVAPLPRQPEDRWQSWRAARPGRAGPSRRSPLARQGLRANRWLLTRPPPGAAAAICASVAPA